jgi:peptide/nickel transport system permease protein
MNLNFDPLTTDLLVYLLVFAAIVFASYSACFEHLRAPWRQVAHNKIAMASALVLSGYLLIALCDSIHFQQPLLEANGKPSRDQGGNIVYQSEAISLFDLFVKNIREKDEKTYSAPLATHYYTKENITLPDGKQVRNFPRLQYGGKHLGNQNQRFRDLVDKALRGGGLFVLWGFAIIGIFFLAKKFSTSGSSPDSPSKDGIFSGGSLVIFSLVVLFCLGVAFFISKYYHLFGTDKVGQDVFYRALKGIRTGIVIGTLTTLIMLPFAIMMGIMAGYFKGWVDDLIQYIYITLSSIPGVLLIASAILMLDVYMDTHPEKFDTIIVRSDWRLLFLCAILGVSSWTGLCRILRGETLKLREMEYVQASESLGVGHFKILWKHIVPNVMHIVLITVVLGFSSLVLAEAVLSYVGVGVDPSMESWGNMINAATLELAREPIVWWNLAAAFVLMFGLVLSANLFADAVRDAFDPRLRTR